MSLSYTARRRMSLVILLLGLPIYIVAAVTMVSWLNRPALLVELAVYVSLGLVWVLPLRSVFRGVGQPEPETDQANGESAENR